MKRCDVRGRFRGISVPVMAVWFSAAVCSWGGGSDSALLKDFTEAFPAATHAKILLPTSGLSRTPRVVEVRNGDVLLGFGVELKVKSRSGPFRMLVSVSPAETVIDVQIPKYPHRRGRAVKKQTFLDQFKGAAYGDPLRLGEEIDGVSGATSSSTALTEGVRQALLLVHRYRKVEG